VPGKERGEKGTGALGHFAGESWETGGTEGEGAVSLTAVIRV